MKDTPAVSDAASYALPSISALSINDNRSAAVNPPAAGNPTFRPPPPGAFPPGSSVIMHVGGTVPVQCLLLYLSSFGVILSFEYYYFGSLKSIGTCKVTYATVESKTALLTTPNRIYSDVEIHISGEACPFNCGF
ncbi:hypothetical protein CASFOL_027886 [Castilleja foliolosa]|uniref:Uncharacterized protein n=1 Tax=Castilleja foliolosa TaxID=1961234 RepID=A0ABD3CJC5_9LAMI